MTAPQDTPALGDEEATAVETAVVDALMPHHYSEWDDGDELNKVVAQAMVRVRPVVAVLLSSAREEGANAALINETRRRCPSCEHLIDVFHQSDGCWYTISVGARDANLVCPCGMPAALAQHALDLIPPGAAGLAEQVANDITAVLYMADSGEDAMAEIEDMLAGLVADAEQRGAAQIWSEYAREYESGAKMPRWDEDPAVAANGWRPGRCGNCGEALPR